MARTLDEIKLDWCNFHEPISKEIKEKVMDAYRNSWSHGFNLEVWLDSKKITEEHLDYLLKELNIELTDIQREAVLLNPEDCLIPTLRNTLEAKDNRLLSHKEKLIREMKQL